MSYPPYPPTPANPFPNNLSPANWTALYDASLNQNPPANAYMLASISMVESKGGLNTGPGDGYDGVTEKNGTNSYGLMQINETNFGQTFNVDGVPTVLTINNVNDPRVNAAAGAAIWSAALAKNGGDTDAALRTYAGASRTNPDVPYVDGVNKYYANMSAQAAQSAQSQGTPTGTSANFNRSIVAATGLPPVSASAADIAALTPKLYIDAGLDVTPWYKDPNLLTGNPRVSKTKAPVVFKVMLKRDGSQWLPVNPSANPTNQIPLEIRLNASMKEFNITSKHNFHQQQTRTGWHLTMWGMQADTIEGQCTTGVFMNQMGLTDFYSTSTVSDTLQQLLMSGYRFRSAPNGQVITTYAPAGMGGAPAAGPVQPGADSPTTPSDYTMLMQNERVPDISEAMRVAAQDAFVEFLSLFKMNGNVWHHNAGYQNTGQDLTQAGTSLYSSTTGISNTQMNARNNDILTRGYVTMRYKSNTYYGFFKSLSWQMSAEKPFQWTFSFVFQVERTINQLYLPR